MTAEQAIEIITNAIQTEHMTAEQDRALAIAQKAMGKQIAKKPILSDRQEIRYACCYDCPNCGRSFSGTGIADNCYHCGQALDWGQTLDWSDENA